MFDQVDVLKFQQLNHLMYDSGIARCQPGFRLEYPLYYLTSHNFAEYRRKLIVVNKLSEGLDEVKEYEDSRFDFLNKRTAMVGDTLLTYTQRTSPLRVMQIKNVIDKSRME